MATSVQIELMVDEKGAVQGVRQFTGSVQATSVEVKSLDATLQKLNAHLDQLGQRAKQPFEQINKGAREAKEGLHLATEELDIHLPRALRNLAAQSKLVQTAIGAIGPGLIALGSIQIGAIFFSAIVEGAEKAWHFMTGLSKGTEDYLEQVEKTRTEDFGNARSIEDTRLRIDQATDSIKEFQEKAEDARQTVLGWRQLANVVPGAGAIWQYYHAQSEGNDLDDQAAKLKAQRDKLQRVQEGSQFHEGRQGSIDVMHGLDGELTKLGQINAQYQKKIDLAAEARRYTVEQDRILGNPVSPQSGAEEEAIATSQAKEERDTAIFNLRKEQAQELAHMREAALEAGLRGSSLYHAQEAAAIADLKFKEMDSAAARNAIHLKFHNEQMKRIQDETLATEKIERTAAVAGTSGIAKTQAEGENRLADIRDETFSDVDQSGHSALAERQRKAARISTNAEILAAEKSFRDRVDQLADESAMHEMSGFARIRAEAEKQTKAFTLEYEKQYGSDRNSPNYQGHIGDLNRGIGIIRSGEDEQERQLAQRNADETAQIEAQACARSLSAEKQQTAAIQAEYDERQRKYGEELKQQEISQDDYNRRVAAAAEERDAQMVEAAKAAREKMAGEFSRFFKDPLGSLKEMGEKAAGEAAAAMVQRVQGRFGGAADASRGAHGLPGMDDMFGGLWTRIAGTRDGVNHGINRDRAAEVPTPGAPRSGLISLASAQIRIGTATIFGSSSATAAAEGFRPGGGSTSLLGSGFSAPASSTGGAPGGDFSGSGSTASSGPGMLSAGLGDADKGFGLFSQAKNIFAPGSPGSKIAASGTQDLGGGGMPDLAGIFGTSKPKVTGPANNGMFGGGGIMANARGAAGGAMGLFSAYEGNGGFGGTASGAMSGMELGMSLGGPIGAAIGAVGGAILGAIGFGGKEKARVYDLKTVRPRIGNDTSAFQQGSMDYLSAFSDLQALDAEARKTLDKMGGSARGYYWSTINGEIKQAEAKLTREEKTGRSQVTMSAAQFDIGADSIPRDGWGIIHKRERIIPSNQNERITRAIERGASMEAIHKSYQTAMTARDARTGSSSTIHNHEYNVRAWDSKSVVQMLMDNKHTIRAAQNASYAENSGGADA